MKTRMRSGKITRRGVSLLLMMCLLIALLPTASAAVGTIGAYGSVTVTTKNVVIRTSPAGSRTGYFAQKGTYPMIGPAYDVDGVTWYNLQTDDTAGFVSGNYAIGNYGSAGMPPTDKQYVDILAATTIIEGADPENPTPSGATHSIAAGTILQLVDGTPYSATVGGVTGTYINVYYYDGTAAAEYHMPYTNDVANGIMTTDNLNNHISEVTWKASTTGITRDDAADGDYYTHALQAALYVLEYYDDDVDGFYGPLTEAAVMDFRDDNGMSTSSTADATVFDKAFEQAVARLEYMRSTPGLSGDITTPTVNMIQTTVEKLRIRKSYSTSSEYVGRIEAAGTVLSYTRTQLSGSVTWYYIQYQGTYGWVMGTYVTPYNATTGGGTTTPTVTNYGTVTITKKLVAIRTSPNGSRSGYHVNTGDVCTMIGPSSDAGGYTWYNIRTESGRTGWVRGDCADPDFGSAGMPVPDEKYVQFLYDSMTVTKGNSPDSAVGSPVTVAKNTVLQFVNGTSYPNGGKNYINVWYDDEIYHTEYTTALTDGLMNDDNVNAYISNVIWAQGLPAGKVAGLTASADDYTVGSIYVHAIQAALWQLGLYDDNMDGDFGTKTNTGVVKFKQDNSISSPAGDEVDQAVSIELFNQAIVALQLKLSAAPDTGDGSVPSSGSFGTYSVVKKGSWQEVDGGARSLFPKGTVATVMSATNPSKVFRVYRWSGANHADVVPYDASDTQILSSLLGVSYTGAPSSSELASVIASGSQDWPDNTWPKYRWGGTTYANAYKIPVWVNLNGTVYCASIYVIPHGFTGVNTSSFTSSKLNGEYFHERNNMYGMICMHFYGSTTHASGIMDPTHMTNINTAYNAAASQFGASLVK